MTNLSNERRKLDPIFSEAQDIINIYVKACKDLDVYDERIKEKYCAEVVERNNLRLARLKYMHKRQRNNCLRQESLFNDFTRADSIFEDADGDFPFILEHADAATFATDDFFKVYSG